MVITTGHDSHRVSGSMRGKMFLENKYLYIVEFVQYCQGNYKKRVSQALQ